MRRLPIFLAVSFVLAACDSSSSRVDKVEVAASLPRSVVDSIRMRRNTRLEALPDTFGARGDSGRIAGSADAKVWVVVTSDFQCPECRTFALEVLPKIREEFVAKGQARLAFVNYPQDKYVNARFAAHAALCAAYAGHFWATHDSLFANQAAWARSADPRPYMDSLAVHAGVPAASQANCTERQRMLHTLTNDIQRSFNSGITELPTVYVGERRLPREALTTDGLRQAIREALATR